MINSNQKASQPGDNMKARNSIRSAIFALLLSTLSYQLSTFAQGPLTPPGAPAPTMKTLDQIEARTAISSAPFTITQPGSYYLTTNLNVTSGDAITINTNQVTLDLNGFTISSTTASASGYAIQLAVPGGNSDITIFNGHIKSGVTNNAGVFAGPGFRSGIDEPGVTVQNVRVTGVSVSGILSYGIYLGVNNSSVVESCTVKTVGYNGIVADSVSRCTVNECGSYGIYATTASDCHADAVGNGTGLYTTTANNCYGSSTGSGTGLYASGSAIGCYGSSASGVGINAHLANSCTVGGGTTNITYKYNMP